jgi:putative DNA methylase
MKKKLIEVALPLDAVNVACKADKDRKTGSIRNLHKWFAPMPVPALRALIFAALVDDPDDDVKRDQLLLLIERLVASVVEAPDPQILREARERVRASFAPDAPPKVFDPFCGGGSTLVEAQRLGLESVGSDLNPVPVLISRLLTQYAPKLRHRSGITPQQTTLGDGGAFAGFRADVRHYAARIRGEAWSQLAQHYPAAPNGDPVSAWIWARTVPSPDPRFRGAPTPLVTNWWLSKNRTMPTFVVPEVDRLERKVTFHISQTGEPEPPAKTRCLFSDAPIDFEYIRKSGRARELGYQMVAFIGQSSSGRSYFAPTSEQLDAASSATPMNPPAEELPERALSFGVQAYGLRLWSELFTPRQLLMLETFADSASLVTRWVIEDGGDAEYAQAIAATLALCVGKLAQFSTELAVLDFRSS